LIVHWQDRAGGVLFSCSIAWFGAQSLR
jgi:hypothetical protein